MVNRLHDLYKEDFSNIDPFYEKSMKRTTTRRFLFYSPPPAQAKYMTFMVSWCTVTALAMAAGPLSPSVPPEMLDWEPSET